MNTKTDKFLGVTIGLAILAGVTFLATSGQAAEVQLDPARKAACAMPNLVDQVWGPFQAEFSKDCEYEVGSLLEVRQVVDQGMYLVGLAHPMPGMKGNRLAMLMIKNHKTLADGDPIPNGVHVRYYGQSANKTVLGATSVVHVFYGLHD